MSPDKPKSAWLNQRCIFDNYLVSEGARNLFWKKNKTFRKRDGENSRQDMFCTMYISKKAFGCWHSCHWQHNLMIVLGQHKSLVPAQDGSKCAIKDIFTAHWCSCLHSHVKSSPSGRINQDPRAGQSQLMWMSESDRREHCLLQRFSGLRCLSDKVWRIYWCVCGRPTDLKEESWLCIILVHS